MFYVLYYIYIPELLKLVSCNLTDIYSIYTSVFLKMVSNLYPCIPKLVSTPSIPLLWFLLYTSVFLSWYLLYLYLCIPKVCIYSIYVSVFFSWYLLHLYLCIISWYLLYLYICIPKLVSTLSIHLYS